MIARIAVALLAASVAAAVPVRAERHASAPARESKPAPIAGEPDAAGTDDEPRAAVSAAAPPSHNPLEPRPPAAPAWPAFELLGQAIEPGASRELDFRSRDDFSSYLVAFRGVAPGPTLCVTAGVHGDELNGVAIARQLIDTVDPELLRGTLVVSPIVNAHGFRAGSRYLPDRRDLNRHFPGRPYGSVAARIAHQLFEQVIRRCEALVDLHTGSLNRTNVAQIRTDLREVANLRLAWGFGTEHLVHSVGQPGTLRRAANDAGIPAVLYEAGEPHRIDADEIARGVAALRVLLESLGMVDGHTPRPGEQHLYGHTHWIRSDQSGIYVPSVEVGDVVEIGQRIGTITDPFSKSRTDVLSPLPGRVLGMALGQVVIPGFALFHLGLEAPSVGTGDDDDELPPNGDAGPEPEDPVRAELVDERPE